MAHMADSGSSETLGESRSRQKFLRRLEASSAFVRYTDDDRARVFATRSLLLPHADAIADAVYGHLLAHAETAQQFTRADGTPDEGIIAARSHTLKEWLIAAIESPLDEQAAGYLAGVGRAHTRRGAGAESWVKGRYMVLTISFVQSALLGLLNEAIEDRAEMVATVAAWNKLLMIQLDLFLAVYGSAEGNPHWY
jgi:hypothetical protein